MNRPLSSILIAAAALAGLGTALPAAATSAAGLSALASLFAATAAAGGLRLRRRARLAHPPRRQLP